MGRAGGKRYYRMTQARVEFEFNPLLSYCHFQRLGIAYSSWTCFAAMHQKASEKISFLELARRVIKTAGGPLSASEIWDEAQITGLVSLLDSVGKTPGASLGARLYTDVQKPSSTFIKLGGAPSDVSSQDDGGHRPEPAAAGNSSNHFSCQDREILGRYHSRRPCNCNCTTNQ